MSIFLRLILWIHAIGIVSYGPPKTVKQDTFNVGRYILIFYTINNLFVCNKDEYLLNFNTETEKYEINNFKTAKEIFSDR